MNHLMKRRTHVWWTGSLATAAIASWLLLAPAAAHEGHDHLFLGTITAIEQNRIEVRGRENKDEDERLVWIRLTDETKYLRGRTPASADDLAVGLRVVVNIGAAKEPLTAKEVRMAARP
jgi:hypothetical protein